MNDYVPASEGVIGTSANYWLRDKLLEAQAMIKQLRESNSDCLIPSRRLGERRAWPNRRSSLRRDRSVNYTGQFGRRSDTDRRKS